MQALFYYDLCTLKISNEKIQFNYVNIQQQVFDKTVSSMITAVLSKVMCPSALASFEEITTSAHGKRVALFLDYDGTLSPIVDDHERTFVLP
uniref:Uncharacterized protein n=1 Tax=Oryza sativa subsp. japonica TaxID=39947 RepID=Q5Z6E3_ORYSJ|nr:hypothetical protein [Oryza sativa Japonica Group]